MLEKERDGRKLYVFEIPGEALKKAMKASPGSGLFALMGRSSIDGARRDDAAGPEGAKKVVFSIDAEHLDVDRIEVFAEAAEPVVRMEFRNWSYADIPDDRFTYVPADPSRVLDMTEMLKKRAEIMQQKRGAADGARSETAPAPAAQ
jgi:hypothetical protein